METVEKNIKELVNTTIGAILKLQDEFNTGKDKTESYVTERQAQVKSFVEELQLKGATDNSEFAGEVRSKVKEIFKALAEYQEKIEETGSTNYNKLKLELAKYNVEIPAIADIQKTAEEVPQKIETALNDAKATALGWFKAEEKAEETAA